MRILLAEDDRSIQLITVLALEKVGQHKVDVVDHGAEALAAAEASLSSPAGPYDLILLDVMMPVLNGFETMERLTQHSALRHIPVIFFTAKSQSSDMRKGLELGATGYIIKPFDPMTLNNQIRDLLTPSESPKSKT